MNLRTYVSTGVRVVRALASDLEGNAICSKRLHLEGRCAGVIEVLVQQLHSAISLSRPHFLFRKLQGQKYTHVIGCFRNIAKCRDRHLGGMEAREIM